MPPPVLLSLILVVGVMSISTAAPLVKLCDQAPAIIIAAARLGTAAVLISPFAVGLRRRELARLSASNVKGVLLAGVFLSAHFLFWITSLKYTSVLSSVVIVTTNPIFVGIASYFLFKERVGRRLMVAIVLAIGGGALIAISDFGTGVGSDSLYGDLLALCGAVMASCYLLVGRKVRQQLDTLSYIAPVYAVAGAILVGLALAGGWQFGGYERETYIYFALLAIVPQLLGHSSLNWALRHLTATTVTIFILGEPIGAGLIAYFVLHEPVGAFQIAGSALILVGILIASRSETEPRPIRNRAATD